MVVALLFLRGNSKMCQHFRTDFFACLGIASWIIVQAGRVYGVTNYAIDNLGTLGGSSYAFALNDNGSVVGQATLPNGNIHAFLWQHGTGMVDLGFLAGDDTSP